MHLTLLIATNLVTAVSCTLLGMWASMIALNLEFVHKAITRETPVETSHRKPRTERRRRRVGRIDLILVVLILGFIAAGVNQVSVSNKAADASRSALSASKQNQKTADENNRLIGCLTDYSNRLADALDRRQDDNVTFQMVDSNRDAALLKLLLTGAGSPESAEHRAELRRATVAKQEALADIQKGRTEKTYPNAPRDVCQP